MYDMEKSDRIQRKIDQVETEASQRDWGLKWKAPKKPINFVEKIVETIIDYSNWL